MEQQRLFVRLPNKTNRERWAFFSHKTVQFYDAWIQARDPKCGHDYLFHNTLGHPLRPPTLADEFNRVLCTTCQGKKIHDTGLDTWSTHRLRHTMATNLVSGGADAATVMAAGGWVTADSMPDTPQSIPHWLAVVTTRRCAAPTRRRKPVLAYERLLPLSS